MLVMTAPHGGASGCALPFNPCTALCPTCVHFQGFSSCQLEMQYLRILPPTLCHRKDSELIS
jgi:hypothetical protein